VVGEYLPEHVERHAQLPLPRRVLRGRARRALSGALQAGAFASLALQGSSPVPPLRLPSYCCPYPSPYRTHVPWSLVPLPVLTGRVSVSLPRSEPLYRRIRKGFL
jgi:hypothetical protein